MATPVTCPECGAGEPHLQICLRTWYRLKPGWQDGFVLFDVGPVIDHDSEASADIYCEVCGWLGTDDELSEHARREASKA